MQPTGTQKSDDAGLERLWLQVCASRGTPAPDAGQRAHFLHELDPAARRMLESVLLLAARGREKPGDLGLVSWAASCTRPALLGQLQGHGLAFTNAGLFVCGMKLREAGWDMQPRLAQLAGNPADVDTLRALLPVKSGEPESDLQKDAPPGHHEEMAVNKPFSPWPDDDYDGPPDGHAPGWEEPIEAMEELSAASIPSVIMPVLPTRFERQRPEPFANSSGAANVAGAPEEPRLRLRLFGKSAAHTLEVTAHRRGNDFLGVHVVSIDSAHALGAGGGYDWAHKLVLQFTPEEMPGIIATLMGLTPSVRFGHHGANRNKFIEVRRQDGGLVIVTGEKALSYPVPVPSGTVYYVLDLFCRAMAMGMEVDKPVRSVSDVLMLVRSAYGV